MAERKRAPDERVRGKGKSYVPHADGYVTDVANQLLSDFAVRDRNLQATERTLFGRYTVKVPKAYEDSTIVTKAPLALDMVNSITAALTVNPPEVKFEPVASGSEAQNNAELREKFFSASWTRQEQEAGRPLYRGFAWDVVAYGEGIIKTVERSQSAWRAYSRTVRDLDRRMRDPDDPDYGEYADGRSRAHKREETYDRLTDEAKRAAAYPIKSSDIPPATFYHWPSEAGGMSVAAEIKSVPYLEVLTRLGAGLGSGGKVVAEEHLGLPRSQWGSVMSGVSTLDLVELWDWQEVHYSLVGPGQGASTGGSALGRGTIVKSVRHKYGVAETRTLRGPYFRAGGITTGMREPELMALGVLHGYLELFQLYDQLLTLTSNAAFMTGFPSWKRNAPPGANTVSAIGAAAGPGVAPFGIDGGERDAQRPVQVVPGEVLPFDVSPIEPPRTGIDLQQAKEDTVGIFKRILPDALAGADTGASGYALNQSAYLGSLRYSPLLGNMQFALSERVGFESHLIEECIGEKVYCWGNLPTVSPRRGYNPGVRGAREGWLAVGPEELGGAHRYRVALDAEVPSNRVLEVRTQTELLQAGLTSRTQAMEELGQDPGAVERQLLVENLKRSPEIQKRLTDRIFQLLGIQQAQQLEELGGPPGPPPGAAWATGGARDGPGPPGGPGGLRLGAPDAVAPGQGMPLAPPAAGERHRQRQHRPRDGPRRPAQQPRRGAHRAGPPGQHAPPAGAADRHLGGRARVPPDPGHATHRGRLRRGARLPGVVRHRDACGPRGGRGERSGAAAGPPGYHRAGPGLAQPPAHRGLARRWARRGSTRTAWRASPTTSRCGWRATAQDVAGAMMDGVYAPFGARINPTEQARYYGETLFTPQGSLDPGQWWAEYQRLGPEGLAGAINGGARWRRSVGLPGAAARVALPGDVGGAHARGRRRHHARRRLA